MPTFQPPADAVVPPIYVEPDGYRPVPNVSQRLFRHYGPRMRGRNVYKLTDGSYTENEPFPYVDASLPAGQFDAPTVAITYYGGHIYTVSTAEAAALTAAGYGAYVS